MQTVGNLVGSEQNLMLVLRWSAEKNKTCCISPVFRWTKQADWVDFFPGFASKRAKEVEEAEWKVYAVFL